MHRLQLWHHNIMESWRHQTKWWKTFGWKLLLNIRAVTFFKEKVLTIYCQKLPSNGNCEAMVTRPNNIITSVLQVVHIWFTERKKTKCLVYYKVLRSQNLETLRFTRKNKLVWLVNNTCFLYNQIVNMGHFSMATWI